MIKIDEKKNCTGCHACASICTADCIEMREDEEGFLYPSVDFTNCTKCGRCVSVCPIIEKREPIKTEQFGWVGRHINPEIRKQSTSGGVFTALAQSVISMDGLVFGAAFTEGGNHYVCHRAAENECKLEMFRNSKYVQSVVGNTYKQAKKALVEGQSVCFSGTPCQIAGLKSFLGKDHPKLFLVDIVCRAVPSPLVLRKFIDVSESRFQKKVQRVVFRDKWKYGYQYSSLALYDNTNKKPFSSEGIDTSPMLRAFFSGICNRPSCHSCRFKSRYRESDITIWDCFSPKRFCDSFDDNTGATRILVHTERGRSWLEAASGLLELAETSAEALLCIEAKEMFNSTPVNPRRSEFVSDLSSLESKALFDKYFAITWKQRLEYIVRDIAFKSGSYRLLLRFYHKVFGRKKR